LIPLVRTVSRRTMLGLALAGLAAARNARAQDASGPTAPIQALNDGLVAVMRAGKATPFCDRFHMLTPTIDGVFDLPGILRVSVGLRWGDIDAGQQAVLLKVFRGFTVASSAADFDSYGGERFDIAPTLRAIGTDQVVSTKFVPTGGDADRIDYVICQEGTAWKIVDVLLDGTISRVSVQRSDFCAVLAHGGAPALIASLQRKVVDLAGSSLES
jgi:phospholipid transport system substrate-binding protein